MIGCSWFVPPISTVGAARILDVATLTLGPSLGGFIPGTAVFSPDACEFILVTRHRTDSGFVIRHDSRPAQSRCRRDRCGGHFNVAFAPLPPTLAATVSSQRVDLEWTLSAHSPVASRHVLEVGSVAGLTDLGTIAVGALPSLSVPSAPPGRYYGAGAGRERHRRWHAVERGGR